MVVMTENINDAIEETGRINQAILELEERKKEIAVDKMHEDMKLSPGLKVVDVTFKKFFANPSKWNDAIVCMELWGDSGNYWKMFRIISSSEVVDIDRDRYVKLDIYSFEMKRLLAAQSRCINENKIVFYAVVPDEGGLCAKEIMKKNKIKSGSWIGQKLKGIFGLT